MLASGPHAPHITAKGDAEIEAIGWWRSQRMLSGAAPALPPARLREVAVTELDAPGRRFIERGSLKVPAAYAWHDRLGTSGSA